MKGIHTPFEGDGYWRIFYYVIFATHVILAMFILPLAMRTMWLAIKVEYQKHRAWAKITCPLWFYVSVT